MSLPVPASCQKPLLDAAAQGEQVLHFLDTIPPADLFVQLTAAAYSAVSSLLAQTPTAAYPAVALALEEMHACCAQVVSRPCPFVEEYEALCQVRMSPECSLNVH
jgi:Rab3 GTPase-activating protein catalytic subunit